MADPTQVNYTNTSIPDYAKPYVENMLGQSQALTDINQYPYQSYEGQRVAQWTPMQQQSFQGAETMQPSYQLSGATGLAGLAGNQALNSQYNYNPYQSQSILGPAGGQGGYGGRDRFYASQGMGQNQDPRLGSISDQINNLPSVKQYQDYGKSLGGNAPTAEQATQLEQYRQAIQSDQGYSDLQKQGTQLQSQGAQMMSPQGASTPNYYQQNNAQAYMNPYMQNVVDVQKREAQRQSGIQGTQQQAQAAQAGAFGGGRDAIMRAERERNLGMQQNDIQAQGSNAAYQQALQQFNTEQQARQGAAQLNAQQGQFGAGLGLQGLNTALQGANTLGTLGQNQYQQDMGINQLQNQYGMQQQNQVQKVLDTGYQDFQNYQNYPYKQLGFMSDMLRGLPLTQQAETIYKQPPSMLTQIAGAAGVAKGAGMFKEGGQVKPAGLSELALYHMRQG